MLYKELVPRRKTDITISAFNNTSGNMAISINGVTLGSTSLADLETEINSLTTSQLQGISASFNGATLQLTSAGGADMEIEITGDDGDNITVVGADTGGVGQTLEVDTDAAFVSTGPNVSNAVDNAVVVGGAIDITVEDGFQLTNVDPVGFGLVQALGDLTDPDNSLFQRVVLNQFDPADQGTYNSATSMTIYDSLGNSHIMDTVFCEATLRSRCFAFSR